MIRALLVEDDEVSRETMAILLDKHCPDVCIVAEASTVEEAVRTVENENLDLIFLDVELPPGNGFDLLDKIGPRNLQVIFTTAYQDFSLKAIKYDAQDYLVKPIDPVELVKAIDKVHRLINQNFNAASHLQELLSEIKSMGATGKNIGIPTEEGIIFIPVADIIRCESDGNYTRIFMKDGRNHFSSKSLKEFEEQLSPFRFFRVHHSHLINLSEVKKYIRGEGGSVVLSDNSEVDVSRRKKESFINSLLKV